MQDAPPATPVITQEVRIVDAEGRPRIILSAKDGRPTIMLLRDDKSAGATVSLDGEDRPSIRLANPDAGGPDASVEIDDKGAHVKFDKPGGASAYLFLNNVGTSGVVLIDGKGARRASAVLSGDGDLNLEGKPIPAAKK